MPTLFGFRWGMMDVDSGQDLTYYDFVLSICVPLALAFLNLPKGKSLGRSKPLTNS